MKKIVLYKLLIMTVLSFGQRKYLADKYFEGFAYKKSAELYEGVYKKGDSTSFVLSRIGDSYYNNSDYENAEKWYKKLLEYYEDEIDSEYFFKYSQTLKSNGNVENSDTWLLKFKNVKKDDSRPLELQNNKDYFVNYSSKKTSFLNVKNIATNTKYSDFGGFIYNDALYFTSSKPYQEDKKESLYKWNDQPFLNIFKAAQKTADTNDNTIDVGQSEIMKGINSKYHESNAIFTKDGNTMYFTRDNYDGKQLKQDEDNTINLKIYRAEKINESWTNVEELPFNNDEYSVGHPALSPDEKTLYFVSDMPNGHGLTDIYKVAILQGHQAFGEPENLGKSINTEGKEMFPFVDKNHTMYFASNGHLGLGALDVFESKYSESGAFSEPVNIGTPINSPLDDFAFVINKAHTNGYFSSNRKGGKGDDDIYSFIISICKEQIAGKVLDKTTNNPIANATVKLIDTSGKVLSELQTKEDGSYIFEDILCETSFTLVAEKPNYRSDKKDISTIDIDNETVKANLHLEALIKEAKPNILTQIAIRPIYFDFDKYNVREDARYELEHIVDVMKNNPDMVIKIESHTDSRAPKSYNRTLSDNRAKSTRDYLISREIAPNRIESAIGYGEDQLLNHCNDANASKCTKAEHQLNRRSYFYIVKGAENVKVSGQ